MADQEEKVCDACHDRPAIHHTCYGHTGETRALCMTCFEQLASPVELESWRQTEEVFRNAKCKYCGARAVGGSTSFGVPGVLEEQNEFWCEPCRRDLVEFGSRPENAIPDIDVEDEARLDEVSHQLVERNRRKVEFMRQRVRERSQ